MSSLKKQVEKVLNPESSSQNSMFENFFNPMMTPSTSTAQSPQANTELTQEELNSGEEILREIIQNYKQYLMFYSELAIEFSIPGVLLQHYSYEKSTNSLLKLDYKPLKVDLSIQLPTCDHYRHFLASRDMSLIQYQLN